MKALVVYNPFSGKQKLDKYLDFIVNGLKEKYDIVDVFKSQGERSITKHLFLNASKYDLVLVSGGDGTLNEAISGIAESKSTVKVAYIPGGTVNDLGTLLHLKKNVKKGLYNALHGKEVRVDVCKVNDRYAIYAFGAGKYTDVSYNAPRSVKRIFGRMAYFMTAVNQFNKHTHMDLDIKIDGHQVNGRYYVILGLNSQRIAGFRLYRREPVYLDDGKIDLTLIEKNVNGLTWPRLATFFLFGDHKKRGVTTIKGSRIEINASDDIKINTDGELAFTGKSANIVVIPRAIQLLVSPKIKNKYFKHK